MGGDVFEAHDFPSSSNYTFTTIKTPDKILNLPDFQSQSL